MKLHVIFHELRTRHTPRQFHEVKGDVAVRQPRGKFPHYTTHCVSLTDNFPCPVPCNGIAELRLDDTVVVRTPYTTPTFSDPINKDPAVAAMKARMNFPPGMNVKANATAPLTAPPSMPPSHWFQIGNKGDRYIAQVKLQRATEVYNSFSDDEGHMYIYVVDKVFIHVKCEHMYAIIDDRGIGGGMYEACVKCNTRQH